MPRAFFRNMKCRTPSHSACPANCPGSASAGEHVYTWDGRNRGNRVVARGVYFIRVVGPGVNETRKVLVTR